MNLKWYQIEKFVQELAWRDYWQLVWIDKKDDIFEDLKHPQFKVKNYNIADAIINNRTEIDTVDKALFELKNTGYMHNHMRMYIASICCNIAQSHWLTPAKWMYANLLDGDIASNHLSWQWVAGSFSNKKYYANQDNINKYFHDTQKNTFLDVSYDSFEQMDIPNILKDTSPFKLKTELPKVQNPKLEDKKTLVYNYYNLDPYWHKNDSDYQRILLLEPSFFEKYPVEKNCIDFMMGLTENIKNIKVFTGEFYEINKIIDTKNIIYKEHPTNINYKGVKEERDWISNTKGYHNSFFSFWKKCKKEIRE